MVGWFLDKRLVGFGIKGWLVHEKDLVGLLEKRLVYPSIIN